MFARDSSKAIHLPGSPSLLPNNLCVSLSNTLAFVRLNEVYVVQLSGDSFKLPLGRSKIYQLSFVDVLGTFVLVIASNLGAQIWLPNGEMLFHFPLSSMVGYEGEDEKFMRGVASTREFVCVGSSIGSIVVFNCSSINKSNDFTVAHNLEMDRSSSVSSMCSSTSLLVAGSDTGKIYGYSVDEAFESVFKLPGYSYPCTALQLHDNILCAGYTTGHIRLFRVDIAELCVEVTAHGRGISGLALDSKHNMLASCSPDQYLNVWSIPDFRSPANSELNLLHSELIENKVCTGVAFLKDGGLAVASYDDDELVLLSPR